MIALGTGSGRALIGHPLRRRMLNGPQKLPEAGACMHRYEEIIAYFEIATGLGIVAFGSVFLAWGWHLPTHPQAYFAFEHSS
jgi:hypothetical protein